MPPAARRPSPGRGEERWAYRAGRQAEAGEQCLHRDGAGEAGGHDRLDQGDGARLEPGGAVRVAGVEGVHGRPEMPGAAFATVLTYPAPPIAYSARTYSSQSV
ncbi:hypothetical protein GCM10010145_56700 [Streptomyces ruber]|uniref:Uncharacterized protein n=2 Tax=Streptomyces TaxID=1883 RepID=A0A918BP74_9ACTN|nr:hypothetical protein GCM10010145_56700 [Streptomyces ruber]